MSFFQLISNNEEKQYMVGDFMNSRSIRNITLLPLAHYLKDSLQAPPLPIHRHCQLHSLTQSKKNWGKTHTHTNRF